jgi:C1A family cysteine protease
MAIMVYSSFMTNTVAKNGIVPMPNTQTETQEGGHCVCIVGYNDATQMFKCANSWGTSWGINGYFFLPYNYVINTALAGDLCIAQLSI